MSTPPSIPDRTGRREYPAAPLRSVSRLQKELIVPTNLAGKRVKCPQWRRAGFDPRAGTRMAEIAGEKVPDGGHHGAMGVLLSSVIVAGMVYGCAYYASLSRNDNHHLGAEYFNIAKSLLNGGDTPIRSARKPARRPGCRRCCRQSWRGFSGSARMIGAIPDRRRRLAGPRFDLDRIARHCLGPKDQRPSRHHLLRRGGGLLRRASLSVPPLLLMDARLLAGSFGRRCSRYRALLVSASANEDVGRHLGRVRRPVLANQPDRRIYLDGYCRSRCRPPTELEAAWRGAADGHLGSRSVDDPKLPSLWPADSDQIQPGL